MVSNYSLNGNSCNLNPEVMLWQGIRQGARDRIRGFCAVAPPKLKYSRTRLNARKWCVPIKFSGTGPTGSQPQTVLNNGGLFQSKRLTPQRWPWVLD
jgi:hypothetical protein